MMTKAAVTKIDKNATVLYVSRPTDTYLSLIIPQTIGQNLYNFNTNEVKTKLGAFINIVFSSDSPIEETLQLYNFSVRLTGHSFDGEYAILYWNDVSETSIKKEILFENTLKRFTNNLPLVVFEIHLYENGKFEIGFVNDEMKTYFPEFNREKVNENNTLLFTRVHPDDIERLMKSINDVFKFQIWDIEYRAIINGEIRWIKGYGRPEIGTGSNEHFITVCAYLQDITATKAVSEKLKFVDFAFKNASTSSFFVKKDASLFRYNDAVVDLLGYSKEELSSMKIYDFDINFSAENWVSHWNKFNGKESITFTRKLKRKDGKLIDVEVKANPFFYDGEEYHFTFITDITEKSTLEEQLKLIDFSFRNAVAPMIYIRKDGSFFDFNYATCKLLGYSRKEFQGLTIFDINPHYDVAAWQRRWTEIKEGVDTSPIIQLKRKDGKLVDIEARANIFQYGDLEINCTFYTDITEKKKLEEQLKLVNYSFRNAATTIQLINKDGSFYDFNEAAHKLLGYTREEYQKLSIPEFALNYDKNHWPIHWNELKKAGTLTFETILKKKDQSLINVEIKANYINYANLELNYAFVTDITEKKRIEEELKKSNERYEYATLATSDVIWETDLENKTLYLSNNFSLIFGHPVHGIQPLENNLWRQNVHPEDLLRIQQSEAEIVKTGVDRWQGEYRLKKSDGTYAHLFDRSFAIKNEEGKVVRLIGAMEDITEKKKIAEELIRSNKRYEYATLATSDVIWEADFEQNTFFLSNNFTLIFGHEVEGLQPIEDNIWRQNVHPDDLQRIQQSEIEVLNGGRDRWDGEYRLKKADGTYAFVLDRIFAIRNETGRVVRLIGAMEDITIKRQEEERLRLFETVILNTTDAIIIREAKKSNRSGLPIVYVNDAFTKMTGYSLNEIKGKSLKFLNGPLTQREEQTRLRHAIDNYQSGSMEVINYKKNGDTFWASISIFPVTNKEGKYTHWVSIQRDITIKKEAEKEREKLLSELLLSNNELRQFSYITTHNLRAPLTNLVSICRLLNTETIQDSLTLRLIDAFKTSTTHLNDTLNDLINILIIKENPNIPVEQQSLSLVYNKVINSISNTLVINNAKIDVDFSHAEIVSFNNAYLESIFLNLLTNSFKYAHPERSPVVKIQTLKTKDGKTKMVYSDNGIGMNMARVKDRIFGLYQRFHDNADSKGIGLYLIHSQITALGGSIEVTSEVNVGTTFTITFKK